MEYFNITPNIAGFALGISAAMEEENEKNPDFDATSINAVKTGLMGPLSAIGDTLFPSTLRILATSLVIGMAAAGNVFAPVLFLLMYNIPNVLARWYSRSRYSGTEFLLKSEKSGIIKHKVSYACSVVGLMAIGAMIVATVNVFTPIIIGDVVKNGGMVLQTTLDSIMPKILSLGLVRMIYWLLGKGVKVVPLLIGTMVVGVVLFALGIIA